MPERWIKHKAEFIAENGEKISIYENKGIYNIILL